MSFIKHFCNFIFRNFTNSGSDSDMSNIEYSDEDIIQTYSYTADIHLILFVDIRRFWIQIWKTEFLKWIRIRILHYPLQISSFYTPNYDHRPSIISIFFRYRFNVERDHTT